MVNDGRDILAAQFASEGAQGLPAGVNTSTLSGTALRSRGPPHLDGLPLSAVPGLVGCEDGQLYAADTPFTDRDRLQYPTSGTMPSALLARIIGVLDSSL